MDLACDSHLSLSVFSSQYKSLILHLDCRMEKNNALIHNIEFPLGNYLEIYYLKAAVSQLVFYIIFLGQICILKDTFLLI